MQDYNREEMEGVTEENEYAYKTVMDGKVKTRTLSVISVALAALSVILCFIEEVGIALGKALHDSLFLEEEAMKGRRRYGNMILPMDEALILSAVDVSGRAYLAFEADIPTPKVGDFDTELCEEFFAAFVRCGGITLHIKQLAGRNSHHIIEGIFKSVARSLREALSFDEKFKDEIPSTKGVL
jgi:imidazoleglycerol-phosphate dehydratase